MNQVTPILRIFHVQTAKTFYVDYLGFKLDFEHQYDENMPLYIQVSRDNIRIHLSEHYGDSTPGSALRIHVSKLAAYHRQLLSKNNTYSKPGIEKTSWGASEVTVIDPFGNRLIFYEEME
ncbi:glyoxalase superfamily protein [Paenibacillus sp. Marseille-Q4541]|uniref:glyoxalase superfamily protein n=1 Tax=Paenibacillus sp. Marseille-Q4541 TaxID=2831522 RepID=UPI001BA501FB|nr:glyoxalase superfamily protein [Paenibacillus sp. Marseille-Q4541]